MPSKSTRAIPLISFIFFFTLSYNLSREYLSVKEVFPPPQSLKPSTLLTPNPNRPPDLEPIPPAPHNSNPPNYAVIQERNQHPYDNRLFPHDHHHHLANLSTNSISILLPDWEVLFIASPETSVSGDVNLCLFEFNKTSPAKFAGVLPSTNQKTFLCVLPNRVRMFRPMLMPILIESVPSEFHLSGNELLRWSYLVCESLSTENDVVLFAKGLNNRQGINRSPSEFNCIFGDNESNAVRTAVTSSSQEVFRCLHPEPTALTSVTTKISLEIRSDQQKKFVVPSVAYYNGRPQRAIEKSERKSLLCACTMVYNVAKVLKEWVVYHFRIGVEKFILYDNGGDDELERIVDELSREGYDVKSRYWPWAKMQEAGFSHCAVQNKDSCSWMMFVDVDEFLFSPAWLNSDSPSNGMLKSLLPSPGKPNGPNKSRIGQVSIKCLEFGPSNQTAHPKNGVTQGYTCRRKVDQRHKSIVLLEAMDITLLNVIHHFVLKEGYRSKYLGLSRAVVNHYKYQAWPEFKTKFRRRVSAYVVDWKDAVNPRSQDRTPGLGFSPVEPKGWAQMFCEVEDKRLKELAVRWFGIETSSGYHLPWE
ncbi:Glycosyltransferase family 92 [Dillenia turbinata]|uniref:Glycosyltransferase family 92 protein n=1 Tax=Dillenia turbinata TaxID=194707 RepID=A0AAN8W4M1_9MAGN